MLIPHSAEPAYFVILPSECIYEYLRLYWCDEMFHLVKLNKFLGLGMV